MDVEINSMVGILSQHTYMSNYPVVHFQYVTISFVHYTSIKLRKGK